VLLRPAALPTGQNDPLFERPHLTQDDYYRLRHPSPLTAARRVTAALGREQGQFLGPVGDPQHASAGRPLEDRREHGLGRGRVEVASGLVEEQDRAVGQYGPGLAEPLELAGRDGMAPRREHRVEAAVELAQPRAELEVREQVRYLRVGSAGCPEAQVGPATRPGPSA
jgi:hypothetical protein